MNIHYGLVLCTSATIIAAAGCRRDRPADNAATGVAEELPPPPPLQLSRFDAPIQYDFTPVLRIVERAVPRTFGSMDSVHAVGDDDSRHYAYEARRGPFTAFATGSNVHLRATVVYTARGYYKPPFGPTISAGCGNDEPRPRIVIELVTPITLTGEWNLKSKARIATMAPASTAERDRCAVSAIRYDVTDRVIGAARGALESHLDDIDRMISRVNLEPRFTQWWGLLSRPIRLADGVWLLLNAERLRLGSVSGAGRTLTVQAGLDARPRIVTGPEPSVDTLPLPPLAHDTVSGGFHILMGGVVDYATATREVTNALRGRSITEAGRTITVQSVTVTPAASGKLLLALHFDGDASGTLAFIGSPRYDAASGTLTVPDLDYDLQTDSDVINAYAWLRSDALRTLFRDRARVPAAPLIGRGRALLLAGLNRKLGDAVTLSATIDSVGVRGLYVTRQGVVLRAEAMGRAAMSVKQNTQ